MKYYLKVHNFISQPTYISLTAIHLNKLERTPYKTCSSMCSSPRQECINSLSLVRSTKKWLSDTRYNMSITPNL